MTRGPGSIARHWGALTWAPEFNMLHGGWIDGWSYSPSMPVVPGIGLSPIVQWIALPLLLVWFVRRQIGARGSSR